MLLKESIVFKSLSGLRLMMMLVFSFSFNFLTGQNVDKVRHPSPVIEWEVSNLCLGDTTIFTNHTTGEVTDSWTIYEETSFGEILLKQDSSYNTKYKFANTGTFRVELNSDNGHLVTLSRFLVIDSVPIAHFDYMDCNSKFTNFSSCYTSCFWDFGDGNTSTQHSPTHFYSVPGTYTVKLNIFNGTKSDSTLDDIVIQYMNDFVGTFNYIIGPDSVLFNADDSIGNAFVQYHWAFGDGEVADLYGTSLGKSVWHTYSKYDSTYYVFLLVKSFCSFAYSQQLVHIPGIQRSLGNTSTMFFPNPSEGITHLTSGRKSDITEIRIFNCLGQTLDNVPIMMKPNGFDIDLSPFPQGVYFIRIVLGSEVITERIIRQ